MNDFDFLCSIMRELDIAVLKRIRHGEYYLVGQAPVFYSTLYLQDRNAPWKFSNFLEYFLATAEEFFENTSTGADNILSSGIWQEDGVDSNYALIAYATVKADQKAIIIRRLKEEFTERQKILQKARENLLEQRHLARYASYDSLTGLFNKRTFLKNFDEAMTTAKILEQPLSILMMDIDDFKVVNDTYGHLAGDIVLAEFGALLSTSVRQ